jgi:predicted lipoprotein with Yx(FWY)xxD motif
VNSTGKTLYYNVNDTATTSACTNQSCVSLWPPLLSGGGTVSAATGIAGTLSAVTNQNGSQVQYNGHFLYTYSPDTAPGQAGGEGVGGIWHVATPDLAAMDSGSAPTTQPPSATQPPAAAQTPGGGGYYHY